MRPTLRPAFLVTAALSSLAGCKNGASDPPTNAGVATSSDRDAFHVRETEGPVAWDAYPNVVNARSEDGKTVYRHDRGCYMHGEFDEPPTSWVPPPIEEVDCPPVMRSAHWSFCVGGTLQANADGSACLCRMDGNPPPPPHLQDCPK